MTVVEALTDVWVVFDHALSTQPQTLRNLKTSLWFFAQYILWSIKTSFSDRKQHKCFAQYLNHNHLIWFFLFKS